MPFDLTVDDPVDPPSSHLPPRPPMSAAFGVDDVVELMPAEVERSIARQLFKIEPGLKAAERLIAQLKAGGSWDVEAELLSCGRVLVTWGRK
jgi:hypothetical protein